MSRTLQFNYRGATVTCSLEKVDRAALYGTLDVETHDSDGHRCALATLARDGRTLILSGNTAFAYVSSDGRWLERNSLLPVDLAGNRLNSVASSFQAPIELEMTVSPQRLLDHSIRLSYALTPVDAPLPPALSTALSAGTIFKTDFSYRGGVSADPAFLMQGADGTVWFLVGDENNINFVGFEQTSGLAFTDDETAETDELDFEMM